MRRFLLSFLLVFGSCVIAQSAEDYLSLFNSATKFYDNTQYQKAIETYERILSMGQKNPELYYNLGNAYYKEGNIGKAMLNYERAKRFSPADPATRDNLAFLKKSIQEGEPSLVDFVFAWAEDSMSINMAAALLSLFFALFILGTILFMFTKSKTVFLANVFPLFFFVIILAIFLLQYSDQVLTRWAVAVSATDARNGPGVENSIGFSVPEGKKLFILGSEGNWYAVGLKNEGLKGWIEKKNVEAI